MSKLIQLQKPKVKMVEWFDEHFYKFTFADGKTDYITSVTTKLGVVAKPYLAHWRGDIGNREADLRTFDAAERGKRLHYAWSVYCRGGVILYQPFNRAFYSPKEIEQFSNKSEVVLVRFQDEMVQIYKLHRWCQIVKPKIIASEMIVYSLLTRDAGSLDNVMDIEAGDYEVNGFKKIHIPKGRYVVDYKSGNSVDDDAPMQLAAYAKLYESMALGRIDGTIIIHSGSKTRTGIEGLSTILTLKQEMEQDYRDYRAVSSIWERKHKNFQPDVFEFPALIKQDLSVKRFKGRG